MCLSDHLLCAYSVVFYLPEVSPAQTLRRDLSITVFYNTLLKMPHRCVAGKCSKMHKERVSLHKRPEDPNATMNKSCEHHTRSEFVT